MYLPWLHREVYTHTFAGSIEKIGSSITCVEFGPNSSLLWCGNNNGKIISVSLNPMVS